ncbi:hypothetical protein [Morganella psychrotolerans]|uniref:Uncharacterized protein n=1 Tax=Morganella psychrotolerans TaxID=368603 RepID=A0A1B8HR04_9GAMM|nr:hypothetical protein [Morganella psychrotolerans]OBU11727.1 hypothetical protein AYY17_03215 [Morganella psychrotolerans]
MSKDNRNKVVHYKRAVLSNCESTLQEIVSSIISKDGTASKVSNRQEKISPTDPSSPFRLINKNELYKTILFGQLILFEQGRSQALMTINDDSDFYDIDAITSEQIQLLSDEGLTSEDTKKIKREFIDSILHFGIFQNHVMIVQSKALSSKDIENHLNWLIHRFSECLNEDSFLILQDKPSEKTIEIMESSPVKKIKLGSVPIKAEDSNGNISIENKCIETLEKVKKIKYMPTGKGGDIIKAMLGMKLFNDLKLEDSLDDANLQVNLEITYFRKTSKSGQDVLDSLASSMRHIDEDDIEISLDGGGIIKGSELRLRGNLNVQYYNGLIDENHLYLQMHKWLLSKVDAGEIGEKN